MIALPGVRYALGSSRADLVLLDHEVVHAVLARAVGAFDGWRGQVFAEPR